MMISIYIQYINSRVTFWHSINCDSVLLNETCSQFQLNKCHPMQRNTRTFFLQWLQIPSPCSFHNRYVIICCVKPTQSGDNCVYSVCNRTATIKRLPINVAKKTHSESQCDKMYCNETIHCLKKKKKSQYQRHRIQNECVCVRACGVHQQSSRRII